MQSIDQAILRVQQLIKDRDESKVAYLRLIEEKLAPLRLSDEMRALPPGERMKWLSAQRARLREMIPGPGENPRSGQVTLIQTLTRGIETCPYCGVSMKMGDVTVQHDDGRAVKLYVRLFHYVEVSHPITDHDLVVLLRIDTKEELLGQLLIRKQTSAAHELIAILQDA
jgi:hypothetical protein